MAQQKGIGHAVSKLELLNTAEYVEMRKEAFKNDGVTPNQSNAIDLLIWDTTKNIDWKKKMIGGTSHYTDVQASLNGGNELTTYVISGTYHKETTVFPGTFSDQKGALHFNINSQSANRKFTSTLSGSYMFDDNRLPTIDLTSFINFAPNSPEPLNPDGSLNWANGNLSSNPLANTKRQYKAQTQNLINNLVLSYNLLPGLIVKSSFGFNTLQVDEVSTSPIAARNPYASTKTGSSSFTDNSIRTWIIEPQITYQVKKKQSSIGCVNW